MRQLSPSADHTLGLDSDNASPNPTVAVASKCPTTEQKKTCMDCDTSKTPIWRGGPLCPKFFLNQFFFI
ncbi:hypothetical protein HN51_024411, partial [Arachis hypogaea]